MVLHQTTLPAPSRGSTTNPCSVLGFTFKVYFDSIYFKVHFDPTYYKVHRRSVSSPYLYLDSLDIYPKIFGLVVVLVLRLYLLISPVSIWDLHFAYWKFFFSSCGTCFKSRFTLEFWFVIDWNLYFSSLWSTLEFWSVFDLEFYIWKFFGNLFGAFIWCLILESFCFSWLVFGSTAYWVHPFFRSSKRYQSTRLLKRDRSARLIVEAFGTRLSREV